MTVSRETRERLIQRELMDPTPVYIKLRAAEVRSGFTVVAYAADWLPETDWHPEHCVTLAPGDEVRIVLIAALRPGTGAFSRLLTNIKLAGLRPVVVCPLPMMEHILRRWGWKQTIVGDGWTQTDEWRPPF